MNLSRIAFKYQEKAGILQRALEQLLSQKENHIQIHLTFLEVYNEKVFDLLAETRCQLSTKPDGSGGKLLAIYLLFFFFVLVFNIEVFQIKFS